MLFPRYYTEKKEKTGFSCILYKLMWITEVYTNYINIKKHMNYLKKQKKYQF